MAKISKKVVDSTVKKVIESSLWGSNVVVMKDNNYCVMQNHSILFTFHVWKQESILFVDIIGSYPKKVTKIGYALEDLERQLANLKLEKVGEQND